MHAMPGQPWLPHARALCLQGKAPNCCSYASLLRERLTCWERSMAPQQVAACGKHPVPGHPQPGSMSLSAWSRSPQPLLYHATGYHTMLNWGLLAAEAGLRVPFFHPGLLCQSAHSLQYNLIDAVQQNKKKMKTHRHLIWAVSELFFVLRRAPGAALLCEGSNAFSAE